MVAITWIVLVILAIWFIYIFAIDILKNKNRDEKIEIIKKTFMLSRKIKILKKIIQFIVYWNITFFKK